MADPALLLSRPVYLTREASAFRLAFNFKPELVEQVRKLPYAHFDPETRSWTAMVCLQSVEILRDMFMKGLVDVYVDELLQPGEKVERCKEATLRPGSPKRPFVVATARRNETLYSRLTSIPGASYDKQSGGITYGPQASVALAELAARGILDDPDKLLSPAEVVVAFDGRTGRFAVRGDARAQVAFDAHFPNKDVVAMWKERNIDVAFADPFTEEIYRGELARVGPGLQPEGMALPLFEYQRQNVAVAVERSGLGVYDAPGLGKTPTAIGTAVEVMLNRQEVPRTIVVVPGAVRTQWAREIAKFAGLPTNPKGMPTVDVVIVDGSKKKREEQYKAAKTAKWMIVNYDVLHLDYKLIAPLAAGALLIADEAHRCFPSGTPILTEDGEVPIGQLVDELGVSGTPRVAAWNEESRSLEWRNVTAVMRHEKSRPLVRILHEQGELVTTADHPVWVVEEESYVEAGSIPVGTHLQTVQSHLQVGSTQHEILPQLPSQDKSPLAGSAYLPVVPEHILYSCQRKEYSGVLHSSLRPVRPERLRGRGRTETTDHRPDSLFMVREDVHHNRREESEPLLRPAALGLLAHEPSRDEGEGSRDHQEGACCEQREEATGHCCAHASEESLGGSCCASSDGGSTVGSYVLRQRRERTADGAAEEASCCATRSRDGVRNPYCCGEGTVLVASQLLQGRPGTTRAEAGDRGGRGEPQDEEVEVPRQAQGIDPHGSRVVRVEVLEPRGERESTGSSGNDFVYNIEVEGLHTYVAGGVVVHNCKSPTAKRTKALRQLGNRAAKRLALTGTPVENEPGEWFSLISGFVMPGSLGSATDFLGKYQYQNRWGGYEGARNLKELRERSKVYYMRHTKAEVAKHLPPLRVQHLQLDVDPQLSAALKRAHKEARDEIKEATLERVSKVTGRSVEESWDDVETGADMTAVGMLRLMCSSPRLLALSESQAARALVESGLVPEEDGPKLDDLRTRAAEMQAAGERLVVFTFSRMMAQLIAQRFEEDGIRHVLFTGESSTEERDKAVIAFTSAPTEDDPGPTVFVATDAGAEGLNLGKHCSTLVNFDIPWTPGRIEQRSNRIHRIDGTSPHYLVINLTLSGTIEHGILRMVETKADLQDAIFGEQGGRKKTTGRGGRSIFEEAMASWSENGN